MHAATTSAPPATEVRQVVRDLLTASERFHGLDAGTRRTIAGSLVRVADTARALAAQTEAAPPPLAIAQNAGSEFSGVATDRLAATARATLEAISFPRFVNELITGVFKAINDSNQQQLQSFVELIRAVATSSEGFADAQVGVAAARAWLAEKFPGVLTVRGPDDDTTAEDRAAMSPEERAEIAAERDRDTRLILAPGQTMPNAAQIRAALQLPPDATVPDGGDPERLVPLARQAMARNRQQILSTMVMMGLQRIVVESGRLNAAMRFHIDTRSAAEQDRGSSFDTRNEVAASASGGLGGWGASASVKSTIGFVSTEQTRTTEAMNTSADLNSSVELVFRSDYVPLSRLAGVEEVDRIRVNTLNPAEENRLARSGADAREAGMRAADDARRGSTERALNRPTPPAPTAPAGVAPAPGATPPNPVAPVSTPAPRT